MSRNKLSQCIIIIAQITQIIEQGNSCAFIRIVFVILFTNLYQLLQPLDRFMIITLNTFAVVIHRNELFYCGDIACFGGAGDQLYRSFVVDLNINASEVGETDKEIVLRVAVVFTHRD